MARAQSNSSQGALHEPIFDCHPQTGVNIEVFYADRALETFGRCGSGWFWWPRRRGFSPTGAATGPFATSYAASAFCQAICGDQLGQSQPR